VVMINSGSKRKGASILCAAGLLAGIVVTAAVGMSGQTGGMPGREKAKETAVLAGGCFWGMEAVFERLRGVTDVVSGYAGGSKETATYKKVGTGRTGHAECIRVTFDPVAIRYETLLKVFFTVAHDPTQLNYQGPDTGTQYRSEIFCTTEEQRRIAEDYIRRLNLEKVFPKPVVTRVGMLKGFFPAEAYHQDFLDRNPGHPYIVQWDLPKIERLKRDFPELISKK
jgi:peptide-methionine (S)-S-oxide reductase